MAIQPKKNYLVYALLAAFFFAVSVPASKFLLLTLSPFFLASLLYLGAEKTAAFYAFATFLGALLSLIFFFEWPSLSFYIGFALMSLGA